MTRVSNPTRTGHLNFAGTTGRSGTECVPQRGGPSVNGRPDRVLDLSRPPDQQELADVFADARAKFVPPELVFDSSE